jgi:o-succinylbenzoate synthase
MIQASVEKISLNFARPAGTSRGILKSKNSWVIRLWNQDNPNIIGIGEASIIEGLSPEWSEDYEAKLNQFLAEINQHIATNLNDLSEYPSIKFGIESALLNLEQQKEFIYYPSEFTKNRAGIPINGLIWMGTKEFMLEQIQLKLSQGFKCLKLKIGAIDFDEELMLLKYIRNQFKASELELRVDANGAFHPTEALQKLELLAGFELHSIEQPIKAGNWNEMQELCKSTPLPIALDEELIGVTDLAKKKALLATINPQYIILKPSLIGGFAASQEWIDLAESLKIDWWITSALESNVGLNAIAQFTFQTKNPMPQGLGTGQLYLNNLESPLFIEADQLYFRNQKS